MNCPKQVAFHLGLIEAMQPTALAQPLLKSGYCGYFLGLLNKQVVNEVH